MKTKYLLVALIFTAVNIGGCAATEDDSDSAQAPVVTNLDGTQTTIPVSSLSDQKSALTVGAPPDGWLWAFSPLSKANTKALKCFIQDGPRTDHFQALGQSILFGAALGVLIKLSGRPFLGRWKKEHEPLHPQPPTTPDQDFWLWHWVQQNMKRPIEGGLQGGALGLTCQILLTGASKYPGALGANYDSAATALFLGVLSSYTANPLVKGLFGKPEPEKWKTAKQAGEEPPQPPANWLARVGDAFHSHGYGKIIRYALAPKITLFFLGSGIAVAVYDGLQDVPTSPNPTPQECDEVRKVQPFQTYQLSTPSKLQMK